MRVFLAGATGYVGAAVAAKLKASGHEVAGLTHDPAKKAALEAAGLLVAEWKGRKP